MHSLDSIVGGILTQLSEAQSYSDVATLRTGHKYAEHQHLKFFDVPQISIFEADIDLRFAFAADDKKSMIVSFDEMQKDDFIKQLTNLLNELINKKCFINVFKLGKVSHERWNEAVNSIVEQVYNDIDQETKVDTKELILSIIILLKTKLITIFEHHNVALLKIKNLLTFYSTSSDLELKTKWLDDLKIQLKAMIVTVLNINALDAELSVIVCSDELKNIPENCISKITLKSSLSKKQWIKQESEDGTKTRCLTDK